MAKGKSKGPLAESSAKVHVLLKWCNKSEMSISTSESIKELRRGRSRTMDTLIRKLTTWRDDKTIVSIEYKLHICDKISCK